MMRLKRSVGHGRISPVFLSRLTVLTASAVPAQLTRMRSCPMAARALAKAASTAPRTSRPRCSKHRQFAGQRLADGFVHVKDGDFDTMAGQRWPWQLLGRKRPGDDGGDVGIELHDFCSMDERQALLAREGEALAEECGLPSRLSAECKATRKLRFSCSGLARAVSKLASAASFASATASGEWMQSGWPSPTPSAGPGRQPSPRRPCPHRRLCGRR